MYFLPFITSSVAIAMIFGTLFSKNFGVINSTIMALGQVPDGACCPASASTGWATRHSSNRRVSTVVFWRYLGWNTVLYLSALQVILRISGRHHGQRNQVAAVLAHHRTVVAR
jgi:multiple sugar transport system permease protein